MKILLSAILVAALTGCASTPIVGIDTRTASAMHGKTVAQARNDAMPKIMTVKASGVAFGVLGALAQMNQASDMVQVFGIDDPAAGIGRELMAALQASRGTVAAAGTLLVQTRDPAELAAAARGNADYLLHVETRCWMLGYFPLDWTHYRLSYDANARIIDVATNAVVAQGKCKIHPDSNAGAPTWDQLGENNGVILKSQVARAVQDCAAALKTSLAI